MAAVARVRREFSARWRTIRKLCRELHLSRTAVRKFFRSDATAFAYESQLRPPREIGPWPEELGRLPGSTAARPARDRLTPIRVYQALLGFVSERSDSGALRAAELGAGRGRGELQR